VLTVETEPQGYPLSGMRRPAVPEWARADGR